MKEQMKSAMQKIEVPKDLSEIASVGIERANSERKCIKMTRSVKVIAATAAALAICATTATAVGLRYIDVKRFDSAVVGGQLVNATDYFDVTASYDSHSGDIVIETAINENAAGEPFYREFESIRPAEFTVVNEKGETVATGNSEGTVTMHVGNDETVTPNADGSLSIAAMLENGEQYTIHVYKLIGSKKGDKDLEIFGDWTSDIEVTFHYFDVVDDNFEFSTDENGEILMNGSHVDEDGVRLFEEHYHTKDYVDLELKSSSTFEGFNGEPFAERVEGEELFNKMREAEVTTVAEADLE